jgi:hypothetical protein
MRRTRKPRQTTTTTNRKTRDHPWIWGGMDVLLEGMDDDLSTMLHAGGSPIDGSRTASGAAMASSQHAPNGGVRLTRRVEQPAPTK